MAEKKPVAATQHSEPAAVYHEPREVVDWAATESVISQVVNHLVVLQHAQKAISTARQAQGDAEYLLGQVAERQKEIQALEQQRQELVDRIRTLESVHAARLAETAAGFESARKDEEAKFTKSLTEAEQRFTADAHRMDDELAVLKKRNAQVLQLVEANEKRFSALRESIRELRMGVQVD